MQLVGVSALLIASKYEEIYPPDTKDFVYITDNAYIKDDVIKMEFEILSILSFDLTFPTPYRFYQKFCALIGGDQTMAFYAQFLLELSLTDMKMLNFPPSILAASALIIAYKKRCRKTYVNNENENVHALALLKEIEQMSKLMGFKENELVSCTKELEFLERRSVKSNLQSVRKKYSSSRYGGVLTTLSA